MASERRRLELAQERVLTLYLIWLDKLALWRAHPLGEHHIRYAQAQVDYWGQRLLAIEAAQARLRRAEIEGEKLMDTEAESEAAG